jgi:hypothetical protein
MSAGDTDHSDAPSRRKWQFLIPGPWTHWFKLFFEKYYLGKMRTGHVNWP